MTLPERSYTGGSGYRFGFNGKETDDELKGTGNSYDFGARIYDARTGRLLSVDRYAGKLPSWSPYVFSAGNPILFVDPDGNFWTPYHQIMFAQESAMLKLAHSDWSMARVYATAYWNVMGGTVHTLLDIAGMVPAIGEIADGINGGLYLLEGDGVNASLSFAAMIPVAGWTATGAKWTGKIIKTAKGTDIVLGMSKMANGMIDFGSRSNLAKVLGKKAGYEAHHIVPWALKENKVVQQAAEAGFHMNDEINGALMKKFTKKGAEDGMHATHPAYNTWVENQLNDFAKKQGDNLTPEIAKNYLEKELIPTLEKHIDKAKDASGNLNDYFKVLNSGN